MYVLAFDTTSAGCSICLLKGGVEIVKVSKRVEFGQAEILLPEIKKILDSMRLSFKDIGVVGVCVGPGSFTGVRSSISAARAFGIAYKTLPIIGVSAFEAYLHSLSADDIAEVNAVIIETKRSDFYYQLFNKDFEKITEPSSGTREEIISLLRGKKVTVIGDGVERFLSSPSGLSFHAIRIEFSPPILNLAFCTLLKHKEGFGDFPKPLYLRAPDVCLPA